MRLGIARLYVKNGQLDYNFSGIEKLYKEALKKDLELVIFPRLVISGFSVDDNFADNDYLGKLTEYIQKTISLTDGKKTKILMGAPLQEIVYGEDGKVFQAELEDSALFIDDGCIDTEIFRKEIEKTNPLDDYRYFSKHRFLKCFSYGGKKFQVLLSDDIYSNFNLLLVKDNKPDYILCLDSNTLRSGETRRKRLLKLAKFANVPLFYLNSSSYSDGMLFRGEVILINEDFEVIFEDLYRDDRILSFEVDCEDGTELFITNTARNTNPFYTMEKYFGSARVTIDVDRFSNSELEEMKRNDCAMVTFSANSRYGAKYIEIADYINPKLFRGLVSREQVLIRDKIVSLYNDDFNK
ncbi:MAG: hypothetical protein LBI29_04610 [Rickettsiales bacterium]|nr:hypothetical protein [Rickettsiales bacterium]